MSMDLSIFNPNNLPAHLQQVKTIAAPINLGGAADSRNKIKMKNGRFILAVGGAQEKVLDVLKLPVVIVAAHDYVSRAWYATKWQPGVAARPGCFSSDGVSPNPASTNPQAARCDLCPQNQKGSSDTGGKACSFFKRIVVLINGKKLPFIIDVKSMSIFGSGEPQNAKYSLMEYSKLLASKGINPSMVVTELTFDANASVPKIFFTPTGFIDENMSQIVTEVLSNKELIDEYRAVDLDSIGDTPGTALADVPPTNNGPAPSNIRPAQTAQAPATQTIKPTATPVASTVQKFGVSASDAPVDVSPAPAAAPRQQPASAAPASTADIDALLNGMDFGD